MTTNYSDKKHALVKRAVDSKKSITIINDRNNNKPLVFDSDKKFSQYRERLTRKKQAG